MRIPSLSSFLLGGLLAAPGAGGAVLPLELHQDSTPYNLQSDRGVPLSPEVGNPPGSDGRAPTVEDQTLEGLTTTPPTAGQFQGLLAYGGTAGLRYEDWTAAGESTELDAGSAAFSGDLAEQMHLPMARSGGAVALILRRAQIGAPYLSRQISFGFGAIVEVPETDEDGVLLQDVNKENYWFAEPYTTDDHTGHGYYWSVNARKVFAVQPGPLFITWKKAGPYTAETFPAGYENPGGPPHSVTEGNYQYLLYTKRYVVSGSAVKLPRKIYWTERSFSELGKLVVVPSARVNRIHVVYHNNFPETVAEEHREPGDTYPTDGSDSERLEELHTLWYDQGQRSVRAYNREGRVFVELLGDATGTSSAGQPVHRHLGFEIVDVLKRPTPADVAVELGERIVPPPPGGLENLTPEPILQLGTTFAFRHQPDGSMLPKYYATRETRNLNDYLVHWMEEGEQGLLWPTLLGRYDLDWPTDVARYSHYLRPPAATEEEARETAVVLSTENAPVIEYQDPLDRPRAKLTETFKFFTWLDEAYPAHRTLLRFTAGDEIAFERVFSWLDTAVSHENSTLRSFYSDFSTPPAGATASGIARVDAGRLHLTDAVSSQAGDYVLDDFNAGEPVASFKATFGLSIDGMRATVADGFSFNFGTILPPLGEEGTSDGLVVSFDSYDNGSSDVAPTIAIMLDGALVAAVQMAEERNPNPEPAEVRPNPRDPETGALMTIATGDRFVPVEIELRADGQMDVWYKGAKVLANVATGYTARTGQFSLAARTGGQYYAHWVDDLAIVVNHDNGTGGTPLAGSVATNLDAWIADTTFHWPDSSIRPRVVHATVEVGQRINAPAGEAGATGGYVAGHLDRRSGTSYDPSAYLDPFVVGFSEAAAGAVIPVNAIPGDDLLEVWWFRPDSDGAGLNAGNNEIGFHTAYWPSTVGYYTLQWPADADEIVLASNAGSGALTSLEATGSIYRQNDPDADGYNPNEEHALLAGGSAWATRDDLNITTGDDYSSAPYVLVRHTAADGRPAITPFHIVREDAAGGWVFDYITPAGRLLQPPMPLPLLGKPIEGTGDAAYSLNTEPTAGEGEGDLPVNWDSDRDGEGPHAHYPSFTWEDRHHDFWVYRGRHAGPPDLEAGAYDPDTDSFGILPAATAVVDEEFRFTVHVSRRAEYLMLSGTDLPDWLRVDGMSVAGTPTAPAAAADFTLRIHDLYSGLEVNLTLNLAVLDTGTVVTQEPLALVCDNPYTGTSVVYSNRPPYLAVSPAPANSFTMRFYYQTDPSFDWPGLAGPPPAGSNVPYLRPIDPDTGEYVGDPDKKETESLQIVYRPVWPVTDPSDSSKPLPVMSFSSTLTTARDGLPGVRGMLTANVLYQQAIAADMAAASPAVVLHDPTREKEAELDAHDLTQVPGGVHQIPYQGKWYFPNLPPHLVRRVFYDPVRSSEGSLVLRGQFVDEVLGEDYLLLNVLRGTDLEAVKGLCPDGDPDKSNWDALVDALATDVETFRESLATPGTYEPDPDRTVTVDVQGLAGVMDDNTAVDSYALSATGPGEGYVTLVESGGTAFTQPGDPVALHVFKVGGAIYRGELKVILADNPMSEQVTMQHTADLAGRFDEFEYEWKIAAPVDGLPPDADGDMTNYQALSAGPDQPRYTLGGAGIRTLADNYIVMRYRAKDADHPRYDEWSEWTEPALAEGWIKRVLAGINPFNQRISDLFNNQVNTDVSMLTQAGPRWEGDVALNLENINEHGLIEIYETVLRRGRALSIEAGYNYGPANDALLLAAGYLNDLYMLVGGEGWADAANPTIGIGTADGVYGDIATALFAFKGQEPSLLEEELALLRGRDDFLLPGVEVTPVYNRLVWNYTRGIDAGEVIYALNYNVQENPNEEPDGVINAEDAARMFPQGHGDAYGHYLTALKGYYSLLMNASFDWVPRIEAVNVLGKPVSVDYQDERKFAAAAAAVARAGRQVFDLTWRRDYQPVHAAGWSHLGATRVNSQRTHTSAAGEPDQPSVRHWGADHWASRTGQGAFLNWVVGNAILPATDPNPDHEGIQKIDRTTVPELKELVTLADGLQTALDNAEGGLSPLGIPEGGLAFDINPTAVVGADGGTHFEQVYQRAIVALNNAVAAFDDAKDVTALMRAEQDSLTDFQAGVARQELAFRNALIGLYGTPYPDDIGPGKLYPQGYVGPDLLHYMYVETPEYPFPELWSYTTSATEFRIDVQDLPSDWYDELYSSFEIDNDREDMHQVGEWPLYGYLGGEDDEREEGTDYITFNLGSHGFFEKPEDWTSRRASPGTIQQAISEYILANSRLRQTLNDSVGAKNDLDKAIQFFKYYVEDSEAVWEIKVDLAEADEVLQWAEFANDVWQVHQDTVKEDIKAATGISSEALPRSLLVGLSNGGDLTSAGRSALQLAGHSIVSVVDKIAIIRAILVKGLASATASARRWTELYTIDGMEWERELTEKVLALGNQLSANQALLWTINERYRQLDDADRKQQAVIAEGERIQEERLVFRQHAAAVVQGYRTRDAAFRLFRNEKLERYKTLFDLAARYALLAANAYDYETGLLNTAAGRDFVNRIINSRALGVVRDGQPLYAGSDTGDPGLSSALAEMKADWDVLRGRLGFNNPDSYGTTVSLRTEAFRILPTSDGDPNWKDLLHASLVPNLLEDEDVRRFAMQIDDGSGLPVPGIVLTFDTTIANGLNVFGQQLAAGDHAFSPSSFATKLFGVGVALIGYRGMDDPGANAGAVGFADGESPADPSFWFLDPLALSANPYIYLIPVGVDSMRSPPLGDTSTVRTWRVDDLAIPMPFNLAESGFSTKPLWQSGDSLTEPLFAVRKHQAFRPVSTVACFSPELYTASGGLQRSQFMNNRLVGRSVWNSRWKLIIPGRTLLNDPKEGLDRFLQTVSDIKLHLVTYSYSGN